MGKVFVTSNNLIRKNKLDLDLVIIQFNSKNYLLKSTKDDLLVTQIESIPTIFHRVNQNKLITNKNKSLRILGSLKTSDFEKLLENNSENTPFYLSTVIK